MPNLNDILYDDVLDKVDIGGWHNYKPYTDKEQIKIQRENLINTNLFNGPSDIKFIYTKEIHNLNLLIEEMADQIKIQDTKTVIENEVFFTTKIEGAKTTRIRTSEIHNGAKIDHTKYSEIMVKNCFNAVKLMNLYGNNLLIDNLIKIWNTLVKDCCENEEIRGTKFRSGDVQVGMYNAPESNKLDELMINFIEFYNSSKLDNYPFIKACILHFAFETIHPFCDGNGRMGRLLMNNYLINRGIDSAKAVSFSMAIDHSRSGYDNAFINSENLYNDCTPFIEYMLERMYEAYENALNI